MEGRSPVVMMMAAITRWTLGSVTSVTSVWKIVFQEDRFSVLKKVGKPHSEFPSHLLSSHRRKRRRKSK
jgi:hypothetical protein